VVPAVSNSEGRELPHELVWELPHELVWELPHELVWELPHPPENAVNEAVEITQQTPPSYGNNGM